MSSLEAGDRLSPKCMSFSDFKEAGIEASKNLAGGSEEYQSEEKTSTRERSAAWYDLIHMNERAVFVQVKF